MKKNLEILEKLYNLRYKSGKIHLFHSVNKIVGRFGNVVSLDKIYVSKEYSSYLYEQLFKAKDRLLSFFGRNNNFVRIYYFTKSGLETSLVVAISMFLTVIMAKVIGGVLPLIAKSLKIDPAIMASPLITTIVDTAALIIYFQLSVIFLHI